jgi:argininosuccinate lyase
MVHLSRLAEEIVWWSNPRFGFVRVADAYSTGSSMMPNKRNPDPAELVRGRSARTIAALTAVLGLLKGLPLGYQRDLQEDKPPLFGAVATYEASLGIMAGLVATLAIDRDRMRAAADEGYTTATAAADALVRRGVPFRAAHHVVGALVGRAERDATPTIADLPDAAFVEALRGSDDATAQSLADQPDIAELIRAAASIEGSLAAADVIGGTAPNRVAAALAAARSRLSAKSD